MITFFFEILRQPLRLFKDHTDVAFDDVFYLQLRKRFVSRFHLKDNTSLYQTLWVY